MNWFTSPFGRKVTGLINDWIERNSEDPTGPVLTQPVGLRPSIQEIMDHYIEIHQEVIDSLPHARPIAGDLFFDNTITSDDKWDRVYIKWYKRPSRTAQGMFPRLTLILDKHPEIHLAMVSILKPGAVIQPHCGPWKGSIRVHIGIKTPNDPKCRMSIGGESFFWENAKIYAFDDTYIHMVRNATDQERIILFLDVERKMKGRVAQAIVRLFNLTVARLTTRE